jgi:hypothetical protein
MKRIFVMQIWLVWEFYYLWMSQHQLTDVTPARLSWIYITNWDNKQTPQQQRAVHINSGTWIFTWINKFERFIALSCAFSCSMTNFRSVCGRAHCGRVSHNRIFSSADRLLCRNVHQETSACILILPWCPHTKVAQLRSVPARLSQRPAA